MKNLKLLLFVSLLPAFFTGCNTTSLKNKVRIENKLSTNIICVLGYNYPDLSLNFINTKSLLGNSKFEVAPQQSKEIDTLGLRNKEVWNNTIKHSMLMLFVFDRSKLASANKPEDALIERYYFTYMQLTKINGLITVE